MSPFNDVTNGNEKLVSEVQYLNQLFVIGASRSIATFSILVQLRTADSEIEVKLLKSTETSDMQC